MSHIRRKFVDVVKASGSAVAEDAVVRIAKLYAVEKEVRGQLPEIRVALRQEKAKPVLADLKARPYLKHGVLELDNNTAERAVRGIAVGRKNCLFMGSEGGGKAAAIAYTLIETAKLNRVDPQAWLTDTLVRIADPKITLLDELMLWSYDQN